MNPRELEIFTLDKLPRGAVLEPGWTMKCGNTEWADPTVSAAAEAFASTGGLPPG